MKTRVLVVDDSPFIRRVLSDWVRAEPDFELVGVGANGREAIQLAAELKPDVITLDVEMPICNGIDALQAIMEKNPTRVLMVSSITSQGAAATMKALELGAYDFVTKPQGSSSLKVLEAKTEVLTKLRAAKMVRIGAPSGPRASAPAMTLKRTDKVVVIASSTGGPKALHTLFQTLPKGFPAPILIVQHMPQGFTESFARRLDGIGTVPCQEAKEGERIVPGLALIAPGGLHMTVSQKGTIALNDGPNLHGTKPAADHLFKSAVELWGNRVVGAVLTGMGRDGADGAKMIRDAGSVVYGECEASCSIYGMPKAAMQAGGITQELPIHEIGPALVRAIEGRSSRVA